MIYNSKTTLHEKLHIFNHYEEQRITTKHETAMVASETLALNQPLPLTGPE